MLTSMLMLIICQLQYNLNGFKSAIQFCQDCRFFICIELLLFKRKVHMYVFINFSDDAYCIIFGESMRKNEKVSRHFNKIFKITSPFFRLQYFDSLRRFRAPRDN